MNSIRGAVPAPMNGASDASEANERAFPTLAGRISVVGPHDCIRPSVNADIERCLQELCQDLR